MSYCSGGSTPFVSLSVFRQKCLTGYFERLPPCLALWGFHELLRCHFCKRAAAPPKISRWCVLPSVVVDPHGTTGVSRGVRLHRCCETCCMQLSCTLSLAARANCKCCAFSHWYTSCTSTPYPARGRTWCPLSAFNDFPSPINTTVTVATSIYIL